MVIVSTQERLQQCSSGHLPVRPVLALRDLDKVSNNSSLSDVCSYLDFFGVGNNDGLASGAFPLVDRAISL